MVVPAHEGAPWFCPGGTLLLMVKYVNVMSALSVFDAVARGTLTVSTKLSTQTYLVHARPVSKVCPAQPPPLVRLERSHSDSLPSCAALGLWVWLDACESPASFSHNCCGLTHTALSACLRRAQMERRPMSGSRSTSKRSSHSAQHPTRCEGCFLS